MAMTITDYFRNARNYLSNPDNWHKGDHQFYDVNPQRCVGYALITGLAFEQVPRTSESDDDKKRCNNPIWFEISDVFAEANNIAGFKGPKGHFSFGKWNDDPARIYEEVIIALDRAIAYAESSALRRA